ncbi:hypothetical protein NHH73_14775 [Oxalobacteraceae bacterium OTU3CINTB1]|nr:hypothetical protein NHH73_14775 [Oxalobacteraceae bacterium OTU3CINTB1]
MPELIINGYPLGNDAKLVASKRVDGRIALTFRVAPAKDSKPLWAAVYQQVGLTGLMELHAAVGSRGEPYFIQPDVGSSGGQPGNAIRVSTFAAVAGAFLLGTAVLVFFGWSLRCTDTFRTGKSAIQEHRQQRRKPYSLSRVQVGMWMVFATTAALFLWTIYGSFPELESSTLALVAISTATATASVMADSHNATSSEQFSHGFLFDITTSWDDTPQIHRYQAILVNTLLLTVGIVYVVQTLGYPTFDPSWLQFLGLSGVAQAVGKKFIEQSATPPRAQPSAAALPSMPPGPRV